jgi:predicted transglutaminase-like cysteine proteinase
MLHLRHARSAIASGAIGLLVGLFCCVSQTQADEFDASFFKPYPAFEIGISAFKLASLTPFETSQFPRIYQSSEPFGAEISSLLKGGLQSRWNSVKRRLPRESRILKKCRTDITTCPPAAKRFLAILDKAQTRDGWARIAEINRAINLNIKPADDMIQYGVADYWATPLTTFASNAGDCEDYAIAKYVALREMGIAADDLRLVIVHDRTQNDDHAVTAVRHDGYWLVLDNRTLAIRRDVDVAAFDPLFMIDNGGVKRIIALAPKAPPDPWLNAKPADVSVQISSGWQSASLLF